MQNTGPNLFKLSSEDLLNCYRMGLFPMSESADDNQVFLVQPNMRGILPLDKLHISRSMAKFMRSTNLHVTFNKNFSEVIHKCAEKTEGRKDTWINTPIQEMYMDLHEIGHAHSVEVWENNKLVGGLYGVSLEAAFFGESMFSRVTNASKLALIHLVEHLKTRGFALLDTQFITPHLKSLGAIEIPREEYELILADAMQKRAIF